VLGKLPLALAASVGAWFLLAAGCFPFGKNFALCALFIHFTPDGGTLVDL
jgi:hypothetical protein